MWYIAIGFFIFHAILAFIDEFYFHHKRGLGRWERIGHPADTFTVLVCYFIVLLLTPTQTNLIIYIVLAGFSCLFVTKDEFVHSNLCVLTEMWLHAVLFLLHPILFILMGFYWVVSSHTNANHLFLQGLQDPSLQLFELFFIGEVVLTLLWMLYQIIYWNFLWKGLTPTK